MTSLFRRVLGWLLGAAVYAGLFLGLLGLAAAWVIILRGALR